MQYINRNELSQLKGKTLTIKSIYWPHREWFNPTTNKMETFVESDWTWKMKKWNDETKKFDLSEGKVDYKIHKKKYDVTFSTENPVSIKIAKYNKETKKEEYGDFEDFEFTVKSLSAPVVWDMFAASVAFGRVPVNEEWLRTYDWEESFLEEAIGTKTVFDTEKKKWDLNWKTWTYFEFTFQKQSTAPVVEEDDMPF